MLLVLYVVWRLAALSLGVVDEAFAFASALLKWLAVGTAGAGGLVALAAGAVGAAFGANWLWRRVSAAWQRRQEERRARYHHHLRGREWQRGICATVQRLRRRRWLAGKDARRYCEIADAAVHRLRAIDEDILLMGSLPTGESWVQALRDGAEGILHHLERTHNALVRLLAASAVQRIPAMELDLQEAGDELQALAAALEQLCVTPAPPTEATTQETSPGEQSVAAAAADLAESVAPPEPAAVEVRQ
jgi:hypothetical protein